MTSLKSFIVQEDLKIDHSARYLKYLDHYNTSVFLDVTRVLKARWTAQVAALVKRYPPDADTLRAAQLKHPEACVELELGKSQDKVLTSRSAQPAMIDVSVKIPLVYTQTERRHLQTVLLDSAVEVLEKVTRGWREIFNHERRGVFTPSFKITRDADEVRFQLIVTSGREESYNTLYAVRVEYGKVGTKLKDFDRVYLCSLVE